MNEGDTTQTEKSFNPAPSEQFSFDFWNKTTLTFSPNLKPRSKLKFNTCKQRRKVEREFVASHMRAESPREVMLVASNTHSCFVRGATDTSSVKRTRDTSSTPCQWVWVLRDHASLPSPPGEETSQNLGVGVVLSIFPFSPPPRPFCLSSLWLSMHAHKRGAGNFRFSPMRDCSPCLSRRSRHALHPLLEHPRRRDRCIG